MSVEIILVKVWL